MAESLVKNLIRADIPVKGAKVAILGFTFKENCPDTRNTKIIDIVNELKEYGITPVITDETADADEAKRLYGIEFAAQGSIKDMDAVILAVAHEEFKKLGKAQLEQFYKAELRKKVLVDIKGLLNRGDFEDGDYLYWRL